MAVDNVVVAFISTPTGGIYEVDILAGTYYHVTSPGLLAARKAALTQAGVPWNTGSAASIASYGTEVTQPPNYAAIVWAALIDDADPKNGPMPAGSTLATMAWRVLALQAQVAALDEAVWAGTVQVADKLHGPMPAGSTLATMAWRISDLTAAVARIEAALAPPVPPVTPVVTSTAQPPVVTP